MNKSKRNKQGRYIIMSENAKCIKAIPAPEILKYYGVTDTSLSTMGIASYVRKFYKELANKLGIKSSDLILI